MFLAAAQTGASDKDDEVVILYARSSILDYSHLSGLPLFAPHDETTDPSTKFLWVNMFFFCGCFEDDILEPMQLWEEGECHPGRSLLKQSYQCGTIKKAAIGVKASPISVLPTGSPLTDFSFFWEVERAAASQCESSEETEGRRPRVVKEPLFQGDNS